MVVPNSSPNFLPNSSGQPPSNPAKIESFRPNHRGGAIEQTSKQIKFKKIKLIKQIKLKANKQIIDCS